MKRIGWYISKEFILYYFACSFSLIFVAVAFTALSELDKLEIGGWNEFTEAVLTGIPLLIEIVTPISVLLATAITYITLSRTSEIVAMMSTGISHLQLLAPLAICCIFVASFYYFNQSYLAPRWGADKAANIMGSSSKENVWRFYKGELFYFHSPSKSRKTAKIGGKFSFDEDLSLKRVERFSDLKRERDRWSSQSGSAIRFGHDRTAPSFHDGRTFAADAIPEVFERELVNPKYSNFLDIFRQIKAKKEGALNYEDDLFALYQKVSGLIAIFVMVVLALPFSLFSAGSSNFRVGIVLSTALGFVFWLTDQIFLTLYQAQLLLAELAAFGANILFLGIAVLSLYLRH